MPVLLAENLTKEYHLGKHSVQALNRVNFVVEKGEFVAIMGPSGSGKSTLLHLIGGLDKPSSGEITLAGYKLGQLNDKQLTLLRRRNVGFVFQFFNLLPTMSAEENIILPVLIDGQSTHNFKPRLDTLFELVGLVDRRRHKPDQLSGGEQQRVALARALITQPAIVLADEPTGNLDTKTGNVIMELLRRSRDELGQTVVIVTHDPRAASFADRIVFLRDGQIVNDMRFEASEVGEKIDRTSKLRLIIDEMEKLEA
jgi:putative ABC transport system ATP-binding protein